MSTPKPAGKVIIRNKGNDIPDPVLEDTLLNMTSCFGMASADGNGGVELIRMPLADMKEGQLKEIKDLLEYTKDRDTLVFLGSYPDEFSEDVIQPIPLVVDAENNPVMAVCLMGNYSEEGRDPHQSDALQQVVEYLGPKFAKMFFDDKINGDFNKFVASMRADKVFQKDLEKFGNGQTAIAIMMGNGAVFQFPGETPLVEDFEWGGISVDTVETKEEETPPETPPDKETKDDEDLSKLPPAVRKLREKQRAAAAAKAGDAPSKTETPPQNNKTSVPETKAKVEDAATEYEVVSPPAGLTNKEKRAWYHQRVGNLPKGWHKGVGISVPKAKKETMRLPPKAGKDTTNKNIPETGPRDEDIKLPIITAEGKKAVRENFMKGKGIPMAVFDIHGKNIQDPALLKFAEDKSPSFQDMTDIPFSATLHYSFDNALTLGTADLRALARLWFDTRNWGLKLAQKLDSMKETGEEPVDDEVEETFTDGKKTLTKEQVDNLPAALRKRYKVVTKKAA